jgi:hypothetical protein
MNENESKPKYDIPAPPPLTDEMKIKAFKSIIANPPNEEIKKVAEKELANLTKNNK